MELLEFPILAFTSNFADFSCFSFENCVWFSLLTLGASIKAGSRASQVAIDFAFLQSELRQRMSIAESFLREIEMDRQ